MRSIAGFLLTGLAILIVIPQPASAQLLPDQRVFDFQSLAALFAKRYAPADWKRQALEFDLFDLKPWLDRVRSAKDDLEFFEIEAEYVGKLQDTHTGFQNSSSFAARLGATPFPGGGILLGMTVDLYDGKVLIDSISRTAFPATSYPFQIGDELVSVDGVSSEEWIKRFSVWRQYGNPATTRRFASQQIVNRSQSVYPRAVETPDRSIVQIRRANGVLETYSIPWLKTGFPLTTVGPVPTPFAVGGSDSPTNYIQALDELHNYKLPDNDALSRYFVSLGSRTPHFAGGFPGTFVQRLGRNSADFHFSGTYISGGLTIGYLRIPSFAPPTAAVSELRAEIDFLQKNTDGLVVDVTRNPGGGCYMLDVAASLTPYPFYFFGEQIRATQDRLNSFQSLLESAKSAGADQGLIDTYQRYVDETKAAYLANRGLTGPIPACRQTGSANAPISTNNLPAPIVYTKPMIVLIDELSISAADIFPSMIQDNRRGLLVGTRSSGGGGSVSGWYTGFYSESYSTNTNTLVVRKNPITTAEYPAAPYVENIGARPDVFLEYMTRENLLNGGRTYVNGFTQILVEQIRAGAAQKPFTLSDRGSVSWTAADNSGQATIGYARIQAGGGSTTPSGLAIFGFRQNNTLVTEAAVQATAPVQSGRIYAEIGGNVNTGIALANPNFLPATVSFFFTGDTGTFGNGTIVIPANGQIAAYLDQAPFSSGRTLSGTFTFSSPSKVAAVALRSFTNERGEFLITTMPVADLSAQQTGGTSQVIPDFADGGGWRTEIALINPTDSAISGTLFFRDPSGNTMNLTVDGRTGTSFPYSIPARASQKLSTAGSGQAVQSGSVILSPAASSVSPVAAAVFSFRQNNVTVTQAGVPAVIAAKAFRLYAEVSGNSSGAGTGNIQTGLAIANPSNTAAAVTVEVFRPDGSSTGLAANFVVPAGGQVAGFLRQIAGLEQLPIPFQGVVRVSSPTAVSLIGLRGRYNERNDFLIAATPPVDESIAATGSDLILPQFVQSGGYTTQFVLFSGSGGQQASGSVRFVSQSGVPINLTLR